MKILKPETEGFPFSKTITFHHASNLCFRYALTLFCRVHGTVSLWSCGGSKSSRRKMGIVGFPQLHDISVPENLNFAYIDTSDSKIVKTPLFKLNRREVQETQGPKGLCPPNSRNTENHGRNSWFYPWFHQSYRLLSKHVALLSMCQNVCRWGSGCLSISSPF